MRIHLRLLLLSCFFILPLVSFKNRINYDSQSWVRINLLGYQPASSKIAVWASKTGQTPTKFEIIDEKTGVVVYTSNEVKPYGAYGPFSTTAKLDFTKFNKPGRYFISANQILSPVVIINDDVYKNTADFALRYMRQQRSGYNPYLKDSCHTHDGFVLYGAKAGIKDSTYMDASGGWHDASDYLQYSTTSANATYHLLAAYRDFPKAFGDEKQANGLDGSNGLADVLDEAKWGLDWLQKMHPKENIMFNQIADDRDHFTMRIPKEDNQYGKGFERPLYYIDGEPQQRGKFMNNTKGTSSTAAKFASAFTLGSNMLKNIDQKYANQLAEKAKSALKYANLKKGVTQTVSVKSPYIYAEDNWVDDMELAYASVLNSLSKKEKQERLATAFSYAKEEPVTPWLTRDTANHYQYYPFVNVGHYELAKQTTGEKRAEVLSYYKKGIEEVNSRARNNAFNRGVPFIWCSNNLTVSFAIQCFWYKQLSGDDTYEALEQANFDWIFGCNPWGTSMVYGLPDWGDTPVDPHSAFTHLKNYPIDGGLVDGPVYTSIYNNLIGISLTKPDTYAAFQSDLAVYHDDYGDYSTNEPTMDGTASLIYLLAAYDSRKPVINKKFEVQDGAIIRGDKAKSKVALVFTGDEFADGAKSILSTLKKENINASFFLTGRFYNNPEFKSAIQQIKKNGNYLGAHSNEHLLYASWENRNQLLVTKTQFKTDLMANYEVMKKYGVGKEDAYYFLPPFEWHNQQIANWTSEMGLQLVNFTPGTRSTADYTYPEIGNAYRNSEEIYQSIIKAEKANGLNGYLLLLHVGTDPRRKDKFYDRLPELIKYLKSSNYELVKINELLAN